jgi:hypothetical protein
MTMVGRVDYRSWFLRLLTWDGVLPLCIAVVPNAVKLIIPNRPEAIAATAVLLPIAAFLLRVSAGNRHIASNHCSKGVRFLQSCVFVLGILPLIMIDCFIILDHVLPGGMRIANREDYIACAILIAFYLTTMAIAMYPGRTSAISDDWEEPRQIGAEE